MAKLSVNRKQYEVAADPDTLGDTGQLRLTGTKFGGGVAQCGACRVHVDGQARRSCVTPLKSAIA